MSAPQQYQTGRRALLLRQQLSTAVRLLKPPFLLQMAKYSAPLQSAACRAAVMPERAPPFLSAWCAGRRRPRCRVVRHPSASLLRSSPPPQPPLPQTVMRPAPG